MNDNKTPAPAEPKKNKKTKKTPPKGASVQDLVAHASRLVETAALVRAAAETIAPAFAGGPDSMPIALLQRVGSGPRPALIEAILDAEAALADVVRGFEDRARELLQLRVQVELEHAEGTADRDELVRDEIVRRAEVEFGFGSAPKRTSG